MFSVIDNSKNIYGILNELQCPSPGVKPNVNYGLGKMMCQCSFIHGNKCPTLGEMLKIGEAMHVYERRVYWKSLYFSPDFAMNLRSSKKKSLLKK